MRTLRKTGVTVLTAGIALAIGAVPVALTVPSILASSEVSAASAPPITDLGAGTVTLATTPDAGSVTWSGSNSLYQEFTGGQFCRLLEPESNGDLLRITGSVVQEGIDTGKGAASFRGGLLGVFEAERENASQCARVDPGSFEGTEVLSLELGNDLLDQQLMAESASFRLEKQSQSLTVRATALLDGEQVGSPIVWTSPKSEKLSNLSRSITPGEIFDQVTLEAVSGVFSLTGPTTFSLVSDATFCDPATVASEEVEDAVNTLTDDNTTVTYIGNVTGTASCFGVRLTSGADDVQFLKPLEVARDAQFIFDIDWGLDPREGGWTPDVALPAIFIDFELRDGLAEHELPFCPAALFDEAGDLVGTTDSTVLAALPDFEDEGIEGDEGTQFACIGSRDVSALANNTVTDQIYLVGDARMRW